ARASRIPLQGANRSQGKGGRKGFRQPRFVRGLRQEKDQRNSQAAPLRYGGVLGRDEGWTREAHGQGENLVSSTHLPVLSSQFSVLSSQFSVLSSQFSVLSSQPPVIGSVPFGCLFRLFVRDRMDLQWLRRQTLRTENFPSILLEFLFTHLQQRPSCLRFSAPFLASPTNPDW